MSPHTPIEKSWRPLDMTEYRPQSTMYYLRIRPTQLAASFVKADRVAHMISVLIDHGPDAASLTGPATYYDLGDSYCKNPFWSSLQHRIAHRLRF